MKKLNNKGFILAETLVVSVFLMIMFTMIFSNYLPIIAEYEKRETYDDVDGKYTAYWFKRLIETGYKKASSTPASDDLVSLTPETYIQFSCNNIVEENSQRAMCFQLLKELEIAADDANKCYKSGEGCHIYITNYDISKLQDDIRLNRDAYDKIPSHEIDYILSLPGFVIPHGEVPATHRVIVVVHHTRDNNDYYSYSTMEVA